MAKSKAEEIKDFLQEAYNLETKIYATEAIIDTLSKKREEQTKLKNNNYEFEEWWKNNDSWYKDEGYKYSKSWRHEGDKVIGIMTKEHSKVSREVKDYVDKDKINKIEKSSKSFIFKAIIGIFIYEIVYMLIGKRLIEKITMFAYEPDTKTIVIAGYIFLFAVLAVIFFIRNSKSKAKKDKTDKIYSLAQEKMEAAIEEEEYLEDKDNETYFNKQKEAFDKLLPAVKQNITDLTEEIEAQNDIVVSTKKELDKLYSQNVIHAKYRGLVPVSVLYEYFDTGRCDILTGPNGAYNLYENELRQNIIISELSSINNNLKRIKNNQFYLFTCLSSINDNITTLSSQVEKGMEDVINDIRGAGGAIAASVNAAANRIPIIY